MDKLYTAETVGKWRKEKAESGKKTGFVPTMGALHEGHLSLIRKAKSENDFVICSVFVNPTQFNNPEDLEKYPRTIEEDILLLQSAGCDAVFIPSVTEMYPDYPDETSLVTVPLAPLNTVMEGAFRPGHFEGVVNVVYRFFDLIRPQKAYFGLKDFQQVAIIKHMVNYLELPVEIIACPTERELSGLAKSSRNQRLSDEQRVEATYLYKALQLGKKLSSDHLPDDVKEKMREYLDMTSIRTEYISIVHPENLSELHSEWVSGSICCIAAYCGDVRLIDNLQFIP